MRIDNILLVLICGVALVIAVRIAWLGRRRPIVGAAPEDDPSWQQALVAASRSLASVLAAATVAGLLVVGLVGRLVMRVLAATSEDGVQGRLTEADETIGEITFGGTVAFVLFVGLILPLASAFAFLVLRPFLPRPAGAAGLVFGTLLLATFGVDDPLSPDNVDFALLTPRWLAVGLVSATALLYGVTFTGLAGRFEATLPPTPTGAAPAGRARFAYLGLGWAALPVILVPSVAYLGARTLSHGRVWRWAARAPVQVAGQVAVGTATVLSLGAIGQAAVDIV